MTRKIIVTLLLAIFTLVSKAQQWKQLMEDPNVDFYTTQKAFNKYFKKRHAEHLKEEREKKENPNRKEEQEEEESGYEVYKRWEDFMAPRVYPSGNKTEASRAYEEFQKHLAENATQRASGPGNSVMSSTWTPIGPMGDPASGNAGRINCVRFDPTNGSNVWVGAPAGGLWKSTNGGTSWTTNTDQLAVIGVSDVAIDPTNTQIMYLATGDGDAGDTYSTGILKSTDGGTTWAATTLTWTTSLGRTISKILIDPSNTQVILAATNAGIYRSANAGSTWTQVSTTAAKDIEFKPGSSATVYACKTTFMMSTNNGVTWTTVTSGLPTSSAVDRLAIAVTAADPTYVYVVGSNSSDDGFNGIYLSTNSGTSFTSKATTPNLLGWAAAGNDAGGQGWYTLSIAASPTNKSEVVVGGVNVWRSTDAGATWTLNAQWTGSGATYAHADVHDLIYTSATTVWAGTDGGVFKTTNNGPNWAASNGSMNIAESYRIGLSSTNATKIISGHQDNGTNRLSGTAWTEVLGGDGMACFIDQSNDNNMYGEQYNGSFNRSTNGGASFTGITTGLSGTGAWVTPWMQDPTTANTLWAGYQQIFKSTNQGTNWTVTTGTMTGTASITEFDVAPSNSQVLYVIKGNVLFHTTNGGGAWTNVTGTLPVASAQMTRIEIKPTDPLTAWVTFSGYSSGNKVFKTTNGGTSWTNVSSGLPNLPANCITYDVGSNDALYVGTDVGIYYIDATTSSWSPYYTGLPNVVVQDIDIYYATGKVRAATFGRGVWEADRYNPGTLAPIASFTSNRQVVCAGQNVAFTDQSSFNPTSWSWTFQNGTPATSTVQNPTVVYNTPGTYSVSLTATNANGSNTNTQTSYITVSSIYALPLSEDFTAAAFPPTNWTTKDVNSDGVFWARNATVGSQGTTSCMMFDNYNQDVAGARDEIQAPKYNFTGLTSATLTFDVAYAPWNAGPYSDSLAVMVSSDCGVTFTQAYMKGGNTLSTFGAYDSTALFVPTSTQWRNETVNLNAYAGQSNVLVVFQNRGHYGQAIYVDKINLVGITAGAPPTASFTASANKCSGQAVTFSDASTNTPTSWSWSFTGGTPATSTAQNPSVTYATAGTYTATLTATNANGTSTPTSQTITVTASPVASAGTTGGPFCTGGTINLTSSGGGTYAWTGPATYSSAVQNPTRSPATIGMAGTYTVTVTNAGCSATATTVVAINAKPTATVTSTSASFCAGGSDVLSATLSTAGSGTITGYQWQLSGSPIAGATASTYTATAAGIYNVIVTNSNTCSSTSSNTTLTVNPNPTAVALTPTNSTCGNNNGSVAIGAVTGGTAAYTYSLDGSAFTSTTTYTGESASTHTVIVKDSKGCQFTQTTTIANTPGPSAVALTPTNATCGNNNGSVTVGVITGGTAAYTFSLDGGASTTTTNYTGLSSATHTVIVTDANNCTYAQTVVVANTSGPTAQVATSSNSTCGSANGTVTIGTTTGGTAAYTYSFNGGTFSATTSYTMLSAGTYSIVVQDANSCQFMRTITITNTPGPTATVVTSNNTTCGNTDGTINIGATAGGTAPFVYSLNGGGFSSITSYTGLAAGMYTITTQDANNCLYITSSAVNSSSGPAVPTITQSGLVLTSSSSTGNQWYLNGTLIPGETNQTLTVTQNGNYTVVVTDVNSCTATSFSFNVGNVGVAENTMVTGLVIFPNPNNGTFDLNMNLLEKTAYLVEITDVLGQTLFSESVKNNGGKYSRSFNLSQYGSGVYFIAVSTGKSKVTRKIIVD